MLANWLRSKLLLSKVLAEASSSERAPRMSQFFMQFSAETLTTQLVTLTASQMILSALLPSTARPDPYRVINEGGKE